MAVRVDQLVPYGYTDTAISTFHAFGDSLIREYALELGLPTDLRVLTRPEVVIFLREHLFEFDLDAYRPLGDPTRFLAALATLFSRCKDEDISPADYLAHADRLAVEAARLAEAAAGAEPVETDATPADAAAEEAPPPARAGPRLRHLPAAAGRQRLHRLRRPGGARPAPRADVAGGPDRDRRPLPVHPRRRVPGHEPGPGRARRRARRGASQRDRRRRRRPGDLRVPRRRGRQHPRLPRSLPRGTDRRPATELPVARADPRRGLPARSGSTTRTGSRSGPGSSSGCAPQRVSPAAGPGPARGLRHGRGGGRLDRRRDRASDRGRRRAARPRRSSSAPTATPIRSCGRSTWPASRGGSPGRPGCTPGPRSGCCSRSCGSSPTSSRASTSTPSRRPTSTASAART